MNELKLFTGTVTRVCPSWTCKGAERVFERVDNPSIEYPRFHGELPFGPAPVRLPYAHVRPSPMGRCPECSITLFIGPTSAEVARFVKKENGEVERKHREEGRKVGQELVDALNEEAAPLLKRVRRVSRAAGAAVSHAARRPVRARKGSS